MADRHGGVAGKHEHSHRLADYVAPADYHAVLACDLDSLMLQHCDHAHRSAGYEAAAAYREPADILRVEAVDILCGRYALEHGVAVDMLRHGKLAENAADGGIGI